MLINTQVLTSLELKSAIVQNPLIVKPDTTVMEAIAQMSGVRAICDSTKIVDGPVENLYLEACSSCVLVVEDQQLLGIFTEQDIVHLSTQQRTLEHLAIREVMISPVITLPESALTDLFSTINLLQKHDIRHLPILNDQDQVVGIVTHESLLQALNPLELYRIVEVLEQRVVQLETDKKVLLENRTVELEQEVAARTIALKMQAEREKLVVEIATQIRSSLSLQTILDTTVEKVRQLLGCDRVNIWQFDADWQTLAVAESTNSSLSLLGRRIKDTWLAQKCTEIFYQSRVTVISDIYTTEMSECHRQMLIDIETRSKILVPVLCGDKLWGLLNATESRYARNWKSEEIEFLQSLSVHLAIALQQATTYQQLEEELIRRQRTEAILQKSEAHQRALISAIPDLIVRMNRQGIFLEFFASPNFPVVGNLAEIVGTHVSAILPSEVARKRIEFVELALQTNSIQIYEQDLYLPGGIQIEEVRVVPSGKDEVVILVRDISERQAMLRERQRSELALKQSEAHQRALMRAIPDLMMRLDRQGIFLECVATSYDFSVVGNPLEMVGNSMFAILPHQEAQQRLDYIQLALDTNTIQIYEQEFQIDNQTQTEEVRMVPYSEDEVLLLVRDISEQQAALRERKQAETALIQSEAQNRAILEAIPDFMFRMGADGVYRGFVTGDREINLFNLQIDPTGLSMIDVLPLEIAYKHLYYLEQAFSTGELQVYEQQIQIGNRLQDEEVRVIKSSEDEALFMIRDISEQQAALRERKQAEAALIHSQEQLSLVLKGSNDGWWDWDLINDRIYYSPRWWTMLGYEPGKVGDSPELWNQLMHPEDLERVDEYLDQQLTNGLESYEIEFRLQHKQGHYVPLISRSYILRDDRGNPIRISGTNTDLTELKQAEQKLLQLNQELEIKVLERTQELSQVSSLQEAILNGADYSIISTDLSGIIQTFNAAAESMLGYNAAEVIGKLTPEITHDRQEVIDRAVALSAELGQEIPPSFEVLVAQARQGIVSETEWTYIRKDGSRFPVALSVTALKGSQQQIIGFLGIAKDISERQAALQERKRAEAELQKLSERLAISLKSGAIGCWEWDITQNTILWDERMYELYGVRKANNDSLVYDIWAKGLHPEDRLSTETLLHQATLGQGEYDTEFRVLHPDGSIHFIKAYGVLVRDGQDVVQSMIGINFDISDRKQSEEIIRSQAEREILLREITQKIRQYLDIQIIFDIACQEIRQVIKADRVGIFKFYPDSNFDEGEFVAESVVEGYSSVMQVRIHDHCFGENHAVLYTQGHFFAVDDIYSNNMKACHVDILSQVQVRANVVIPLICDNELWGLLCVHQCGGVRQWKQYEINFTQQLANQLAIAIQQANLFEQLQQQLIERQQAETQLTSTNQQLAVSNKELARATRLKDEFLANMSHELRTPLNAILGMTEGLEEEVFGSVNQQQIKALKTIERSGNHLLELINDILDVAKIESGQVELEYTSVEVAQLCQSSMAFIKQQALKKGIQFETKLQQHLPNLLVDERRIRQVLINLLNNAVKFTPEGGRISLEVTRFPSDIALVDESPQNFLRITIIDTGIGISSENIQKLFQPFMQIDSALNRQYNGTGLGLALVKRIVELHGGRVGLTSELGVGSCFSIELPCIYNTSQPIIISSDIVVTTRASEISPVVKQSPLILLAEYNEANISTFSSYLRAKGYQLLIAKNGQEAIDLAKAHQPELILMDIQMPGMDGLEAIKQIRLEPTLTNTPIIALTALVMMADQIKCLEAGANEYI